MSLGLLRKFPGMLGVVLALTIWFFIARFGILGPSLLASPSEVLQEVANSVLGRTKGGENILSHLVGTLERSSIGWLLAIGLGSILGSVLGSARTLYRSFEGILEFCRTIPPVLALPLLLVAFNYNESAYIWTVVFGCVPVISLTVAHGVLTISRERLELLRVSGVSQLWRNLVSVMEVLPDCVLGARLAFSFSLIIAVVSEMVFTPRSGMALGALAKDAEISFRTPLFYGAVVVVGAIGYFGNLVLGKIEAM